MKRPHDNHYLAGNYAPVHDELDVSDLKIDGKLTDVLSGVYMRNGPNPYFEPIEYHYPFEGDGMIHAVSLRNGKASYRNRFVFHFANAFEKGGKIHFDYAHQAWLDYGGSAKGSAPPPDLRHVEIDPVAGTTTRHGWSEQVCEFPRFDDRRDGLPTRFVYCPTSLGKGAEGFNALMRMDTDSGHLTTFAFETEDSVGKPVFAPNPQGTAEDDGWVMAFVYDDASDNSHLVLWVCVEAAQSQRS